MGSCGQVEVGVLSAHLCSAATTCIPSSSSSSSSSGGGGGGGGKGAHRARAPRIGPEPHPRSPRLETLAMDAVPRSRVSTPPCSRASQRRWSPGLQCLDMSAAHRAALEKQALHLLRKNLPRYAKTVNLALKTNNHMYVQLQLPSAAMPVQEIERQAQQTLTQKLKGPHSFHLKTSVNQHPPSFMGTKAPNSLKNVASLIAVSSCKGGVGKSTIALNLAVALANMGGRVGLLDADIHGPSLPSLASLPPGSLPLIQDGSTKLLRPPMHCGVKMMSFGFIAKGVSVGLAPAAILRGPAVGKVVQQMLSGSDWGSLDYLIVDLPPGTGDVHLTLSQSYGFSGALVVSTPQRLATADVLKGIEMLQSTKTPILSVVENMAHFTDDTGRTHYPFGSTQIEVVREKAAIALDSVFQLPLDPHICAANDAGSPFVAANVHSTTATTFRDLAAHTVVQIAERQLSEVATGHNGVCRYEPARGIVLRYLAGQDEGGEYVLSRASLASLAGAPPDQGEHPMDVQSLTTDQGEPAVRLSWQGGSELVLPYREVKRLASKHPQNAS